jgi:signal peptidase II
MATRWFVLLSLILAGSDQITKAVARAGLIPNVRYEIIPDFFRLNLNFNKGIAWGMLPEWSEYFTYFAIIMVLVILMIMRKLDKDEVWLKIALAFQMAGAIGNMTDRLVRHQVTDFLDVTLFPHTQFQYAWNLGIIHGGIKFPYDWPIFNLADSFVVVGTTVLVLVLAFAHEAPRLTTKLADGQNGKPDGSPWSGSQLDKNGCTPLSQEESLIEIPIDEGCEGLVPLEEVESVSEGEEKIGELPGGSDRDSGHVGPQDQTKLEELKKWSER